MITPIRGPNAMARLPIEQQIAQLEERTKALKARMAKQDRARDTRRKILLGALVLHRLEQSGDGEFSKRLSDWLKRELPGFLTRDEDKTLFADLLSGKVDLSSKVTPNEPPKPGI
ncbi:MAG: mobilization protein [Acidiphilium sp.]|nr:mobilization protein [Acidiphilium sp.]MDD4937296.1 mobilization protein [Acidiphilium sp.]